MPAMNYDSVAHLYDAYVQTRLDVPFFLGEARKAGGPALELTCGTGRVSLPLLETGIDLTCVDSSAGMLDVFRDKLRSKGFSAELIEADLCKLSLGRRFNLVFIPFNSFAEILEPAEQMQALQTIREHLADNGRFICTLHNPSIRLKSVTGQRRRLGDFPLPNGRDTLTLSSVERHNPSSDEVKGAQFYEVRDSAGSVLSEMVIDIRFRLHSRESFESLAKSAGFAPVALYGDYARASFDSDKSPFMIWILRPVS
ncbi:MAG: class I SAM-dependent methyltransferase [Phycisphaerales bacterium]